MRQIIVFTVVAAALATPALAQSPYEARIATTLSGVSPPTSQAASPSQRVAGAAMLIGDEPESKAEAKVEEPKPGGPEVKLTATKPAKKKAPPKKRRR